jgi:hypothetical protein
MGLGLNLSSSGGGNFTPPIKFDARAGRWFRKTADGDEDITQGFTAVMDLENIEVGWSLFAAGTPPNLAFTRLGSPLPPKPSDDHKMAVRIRMWLPQSRGGGEYEFISSSRAVMLAVDHLHTDFESQAMTNGGKLPVVAMPTVQEVKTETKMGTNRNYAPVFQITSWAPRPGGGAARPANVTAAPPSTGSTVVPPPVPKPAMVTADDFG